MRRIAFALIICVWPSIAPLPAQQAVALPELSFKRLLNDLQVTVASMPGAAGKMTIGLVVRYGSAFDPADKSGLSHLLGRMFLKATAERSAKDIQEELNSLGATIDIEEDWDGFRFLLRGDSGKFERSLLILYQVVGEAEFRPEDLEGAKKDLIQELQKPQDPRQHMRRQFENLLFRGTTYGRSPLGTPASIQSITVGDLRVFYRRHFSPGASALVVAGSVPPDQVLQKATRIWGVWVRNDDVPFTFLPPNRPGARSVFIEDDASSPAAQFVLGGLWPRRDAHVFYPAILAARILQERLTKALPTSLVTVNAQGRRMEGPFYVEGQAAADQAGAEIRKVLDISEALETSNVTPEELADAQKRWIGEFNKEQTTPEGVCASILDAELYRLGTNYAATFTDLVKRNGPEDVKEAAKEWIFPGGAIILVRGPAASLKTSLESLGSVQVVKPAAQ